MAINHEALARKVVQAFVDTLDAQTRARITRAQREDLQLMIRGILTDAVNDPLERMAGLIRQLRAESGKTEIGL